MNKIKWCVLILVAAIAGLFIMLHKSFGDRLFKMLTDEDSINFSEPKVLSDLKLSDDLYLEKEVKLNSLYSGTPQPSDYRNVVIYVPNDYTDKLDERLYQFSSDKMTLAMKCSNVLNENIFWLSPGLIKMKLENGKVSYNPKWFEAVAEKLSANTDEDLFLKSMAAKYDDIKTFNNEQALYNAILYDSIRCAFGEFAITYVVHDGDKSLYCFLDDLSGPEKVSLWWVLFDNKDFICSGSFHRKSKNTYEEELVIETVGYLCKVLGLFREND